MNFPCTTQDGFSEFQISMKMVSKMTKTSTPFGLPLVLLVPIVPGYGLFWVVLSSSSGVIPRFSDFHENGLQNDEFHGVPFKHLLNHVNR